MVYTEGEERYRMALKGREVEDSEFVMKIEPEIGTYEEHVLNRNPIFLLNEKGKYIYV